MGAVFGVPQGDITENTSIDDIANWDSLRHMNLIVALEEEFCITFKETDLDTMTNYKIIRHILQQEVGK